MILNAPCYHGYIKLAPYETLPRVSRPLMISKPPPLGNCYQGPKRDGTVIHGSTFNVTFLCECVRN